MITIGQLYKKYAWSFIQTKYIHVNLKTSSAFIRRLKTIHLLVALSTLNFKPTENDSTDAIILG